ncbi:MAG: replication factor C large subunit [archaeon]|nr:MAG: replication factor C large subunit [archaeon]
MIPWTEKYRPTKLSEVYGQDKAKALALDFVKNFKNQRKKGLLFYGQSGTGKTALVYALANELGLEILELNASDFRNKQQIKDIVGRALGQRSLFSSGKIILIDELDGVSGTKDRGGLRELIRFISDSKYPIFLVCNDFWSQKLRPLRTKIQKLEFKPLDLLAVRRIIFKISKNEGFSVTEQALIKLFQLTKGDVRALINDLQCLSSITNKITEKELESLDLREKTQEIFQAIKKVLQTRDALGAFNNLNFNFDELFLWLDENLPLIYHGKELAKAYDVLSLADIYKRRIGRRQHWRFLSYIDTLLSHGIAVCKAREKPGFIKYNNPTRILKLWMAKQRNLKKKEIAIKLAKKTHCSVKQAMKDLDFLRHGLRSDENFRENFVSELRLKDEQDWIKK